MVKSEIIKVLADKYSISQKIIEESVNNVFYDISDSLSGGKRIEIRGFGSFNLKFRKQGVARNPKTGELVEMPSKYTIHFKPGKELRTKVMENKAEKEVVELA